jgi:aspartyl/glutamyl-tRNA(Asn/Gln) amidotransferase C subunit
MTIAIATLKLAAKNARLEFSDFDLESIYSAPGIDKMLEMDTENIEPMFSPCNHAIKLREDIVTVPNIRDSVLAQTNDKTGAGFGYFSVPKILGEE